MQFLFAGMLFVLLDFNLNLGSAVVGVLPAFVGYLLLAKGLKQMQAVQPRFGKVRLWAQVAAVYTGILYVLDLTAALAGLQLFSYALGLVALIASIGISYQIVEGILGIEAQKNCDLQGKKLKTMWGYMTAVLLAGYFCQWIPLVGGICAVAVFILNICFLVAFYNTTAQYRELSQ